MNYIAEKKELKKLFDHYMVLAGKRVGWAQTWIAEAYFWGWGIDKDYNKYIEWDIRAARNGSYVSRRRMMLYYQSFGAVDAVIDAYKTKIKRSMVSKYKYDYPTDVKVSFEDKAGDIGYLYYWGYDEYKTRFANKGVFDFIDAYEESITDKDFNYHEKHGEVALSRAICYIFGFGTKPDLEKAMKFLVEYDSGILERMEETQENQYARIDYYYSFFDALHYYHCLRESVPGSELLDKFSNEYHWPYLIECINGAYDFRYLIRRSFEGELPSATKLGYEMLEEQNRPDNDKRRLIFHDDLSALAYLKMSAGVEPDSLVTGKVLDLTSDPDKKTFDWTYAYNLCTNVEARIGSITEPDKNEGSRFPCTRYGVSYALTHLERAYLNLARGSADEATRRNLGNRVVLLGQQDEEGLGDFNLGLLYLECFRDYKRALHHFDKHYGNRPNEYSDKCKKILRIR